MPEKTSETLDSRARDFYNKALAALERGNLDYAIEMFMQTLAVEPNFTKCRQFLRAAQMKRAESLGTIKKMMTSAKVAPTVGKAKMALGKNPVEAMTLAEQALADDPKNGQALSILAEAAEAAQMPETAAQTLETYTKLSPRDTKALHRLARAYSAMERHDLAREVYERLLQINPNDFDAQKGIKDATAHGAMQTGGWEEAGSYRDVMKDKDEAVALEQQSRVVKAEDIVQNLIEETLAKAQQEPDNPIHERELGKLYGQKGDFDTALSYLEKLFAAEAGADPTLEKEINDIKAKRITAQITERNAALAANPGNAAAIESEIVALELEHSQILLRDAERMVERYPNDLMYRFELGVLYITRQDNRNAKAGNLNNALTQTSGDLVTIEELPMMDSLKKELTYNLAAAYEALGDVDKALAEYKKIAAVDFGYRDVRQKIMRKPSSPQ